MNLDKLMNMSEFCFVMDCVRTTLASLADDLDKNNVNTTSGIFKDKDIARAIIMSAADLRQNGSCWLIDEPTLLASHSGLLSLGASQYLLAGHVMLEAGREVTVDDNNGISYNYPTLSNTIMRVYLNQSSLYAQALERFANRK